ncbi:enoyl-CoA hydratase [Idiomarina seosinensis]|uniref:enoyl-CoA hydratase n=1 Tax=Idiomarina seosinensis TaxID=281739 RepID=UPI0038511C5B
MTEQQVQVIEQDQLVRIRLNRPDKKNAFSQAMYRICEEALKNADNDLKIKAVVFESSGDSFSSGNDLNDFLAVENLDESAPPFRFLHTLNQVTVPVVAKVNGLAIGIGTTLLLHCDLVYSSDQAVFALPFVKLGLLPEAGSSLLLPRLCGHQKASELLLLGNNFDAHQAQQLGIVNQIFSAEQLDEQVEAVLSQLAGQSAQALRTSKKLIKAPQQSVAERISLEAGYFANALASDAAKEAIAAKLQKK